MADIADPLLDAVEDYVARALMPLARKILELERHLVARPMPEKGIDGINGKDAEVDYERIGSMLKAMVANVPPGKDGERGRDGVDAIVDYEAIAEKLATAVEKEVAKLPRPKDGSDGKDADELAIVEKVLARVPQPKDGAPGAPGMDGAPGANGKDANVEEIRALVLESVRKAVDALPPPRDGRDAIDGLVGIKADLENERELTITFVRSNGVRTTLRTALPIPIYRGVHQEGRSYTRGDNVTKNGCQWTCMSDSTTAPPSPDWVQSTKAGRDGRDK